MIKTLQRATKLRPTFRALERTTQVQPSLSRIFAGDARAQNELFCNAGVQLYRLAKRLLKAYPGVGRWVQSDDVLQGASLRLVRAMRAIEVGSMREFYGLAAKQMRRELVDLARHFYGPCGEGAALTTNVGSGLRDGLRWLPRWSADPGSIVELREVHLLVDRLPDNQREVINLLVYQGFSQVDTARLLRTTVRTVRRRWQAALLILQEQLKAYQPRV
jgi:RNA polymerase sigma-70 factor (ECF subfamily)